MSDKLCLALSKCSVAITISANTNTSFWENGEKVPLGNVGVLSFFLGSGRLGWLTVVILETHVTSPISIPSYLHLLREITLIIPPYQDTCDS